MDNTVIKMSKEYAFELKKLIEKVIEYNEKTEFLPSEDFDKLHSFYEALQIKLGVEL